MELVLVVTFAGALGRVLRYILPARSHHGLAIMPATGVVVGSLGWALSIWVGLDASGPWGWVIALGGALIACTAIGLWLPRKRSAEDDARWSELTKA